MMKWPAYGLLGFLFMISCGSESTEIRKKHHPSDETLETESAPEKLNETSLSIEGFCDCLEKKSSGDCIEEQIIKINPSDPSALEDALLLNPCYQEKVVHKEAEKLCDCLNSINQVSLKCDELQKELDRNYRRKEQKVISEYFQTLDCLPEL